MKINELKKITDSKFEIQDSGNQNPKEKSMGKSLKRKKTKTDNDDDIGDPKHQTCESSDNTIEESDIESA